MAPSDSLEAQMRQMFELHGLTSVSFTAYAPRDGSMASPFECSMHHEKSAARAYGVTFGYGNTMQAAYEDAVSILDAARAPKLELVA